MKHQVELNKRSDRWYALHVDSNLLGGWYALHVDGNLLGEFIKNREGHWFFYPYQGWRDSQGDSGWDITICKAITNCMSKIRKGLA